MNLIGLSCIFPVPNMQKTMKYYVSCLGFKAVDYTKCNEPHICLYRDNTEIILLKANTDRIFPNRELYGYGYDAYLYTDNQESLEKEFSIKGVKIIKHSDITDYNNREFVIEDSDGRWLAFGLKLKD